MKDVLKQNPDLVTKIIDGRAAIMDPEMCKVLSLNEVGTFIWEMVDGSNDKEVILEGICKEFNVSKGQALFDMEEFMAVLVGKKLLLPVV